MIWCLWSVAVVSETSKKKKKKKKKKKRETYSMCLAGNNWCASVRNITASMRGLAHACADLWKQIIFQRKYSEAKFGR